MAGVETFVEELGLRAFANAGCAEEDETPERIGRDGERRTLCGGALEPGGTIGLGGHGGTFGAATSSDGKGARLAVN